MPCTRKFKSMKRLRIRRVSSLHPLEVAWSSPASWTACKANRSQKPASRYRVPITFLKR